MAKLLLYDVMYNSGANSALVFGNKYTWFSLLDGCEIQGFFKVLSRINVKIQGYIYVIFKCALHQITLNIKRYY